MSSVHWSKPRSGAFRVEHVAGRGYVVLDAEDAIVCGPFGARDVALMRMESRQHAADLQARRGPRACMCCGSSFPSEGIHNRLCEVCRRRDDGGSLGIAANSTANVRRAARSY